MTGGASKDGVLTGADTAPIVAMAATRSKIMSTYRILMLSSELSLVMMDFYGFLRAHKGYVF